ncbi:MAG: LysR substrate-binding domain-containing protein [Hyphomicrobiaceae bacterium]
MVTFKQLRYFDALVRLGHFGRAAEHCAISQPALSMQISELERTLGLVLIERGHKAISFTQAGLEVAARARRILHEVRDLGDMASQCAGTLNGSLRLGVIPSIAPYLLPPALPLLRQRYPGLELHLRETQTRQLVAELEDGQLDVLVLALPVEDAELETLALFTDRFLLALPSDRALNEPVRLTPELLRDNRMLLRGEGHCLREQALAFCELRQVDSIDTFGASSLSTLVQMVANGLGLTLVPEMAAGQESRGAGIRLLRLARPEPARTVGLAWRSTSPRHEDFMALGAVLREAMPGMPDVEPPKPGARARRRRARS